MLLSEQLTRVLDRRTGQDSVLWNMFAIFGAANVALSASIVSGENSAIFRPENLLASICYAILGFAVCTVWRLLQERALLHIEAVEESLRYLEKQLKMPSMGSLMPVVDGKPVCGKIPGRLVMRIVVICAQAGWIMALIIAIILKISASTH